VLNTELVRKKSKRRRVYEIKKESEGENNGKNPFKEVFFNFSSSLITPVVGLFTFLFNLIVYFYY